MRREFVEIELFMKTWEAIGLTDDDLRDLQQVLLENPNTGAVIQGTGGARKMRIAFYGKGKSGSGRVIYVDFAVSDRIYLIMAYPKSKQETLSDAQKKAARTIIEELRKEEHRYGKEK
jgi:hypothetical protein